MHRFTLALLKRTVPAIVLASVVAGCSSTVASTAPPETPLTPASTDPPTASIQTGGTDPESTQPTTSVTAPPRPSWLGQRTLPTGADGRALAADTPEELVGRSFATHDTLPPPATSTFVATIEALNGEPLERSSWNESCPVEVSELAYLTVTFWGFDGLPHTGELIVHAAVADDLAGVFETLFAERYPIEEMRVVTDADIDAPPIGDTNNTSAFVCRVVEGTTVFSEHASGLAVDINPFHNPFVKGDVILPELARHYADRSIDEEALIHEGDPIVAAFSSIGWSWGGNWTSLKDYQHFSHNGQ